jgi:hypothetical protein
MKLGYLPYATTKAQHISRLPNTTLGNRQQFPGKACNWHHMMMMMVAGSPSAYDMIPERTDNQQLGSLAKDTYMTTNNRWHDQKLLYLPSSRIKHGSIRSFENIIMGQAISSVWTPRKITVGLVGLPSAGKSAIVWHLLHRAVPATIPPRSSKSCVL